MGNDIAKVANEGRVGVGGGDEDIKATFCIGKRVGVAVMAGQDIIDDGERGMTSTNDDAVAILGLEWGGFWNHLGFLEKDSKETGKLRMRNKGYCTRQTRNGSAVGQVETHLNSYYHDE